MPLWMVCPAMLSLGTFTALKYLHGMLCVLQILKRLMCDVTMTVPRTVRAVLFRGFVRQTL